MPSARFALALTSALAECATGCAPELPDPVAPVPAELSQLAGCRRVAGEQDGAPAQAAPPGLDERDLGICDVVPDARQCTRPRPPLRYSSVDGALPAHARPRCNDPRQTIWDNPMHARSLPGPASAWPPGPDIVVLDVAADGVDAHSARRETVDILAPLLACYEAQLVGSDAGAAQGAMFVTALVAGDGSVARVETTTALPEEISRCAVSLLREQRFEPPHEDLASVEVNLRFVVRTTQ